MPSAPDLKAPPRNELSAIGGISERVMRYLESIAIAVNDTRTLTGSGAPTGVRANSSRLYIDLDSGDLYKNTDPEYGASVGWVLV